MGQKAGVYHLNKAKLLMRLPRPLPDSSSKKTGFMLRACQKVRLIASELDISIGWVSNSGKSLLRSYCQAASKTRMALLVKTEVSPRQATYLWQKPVADIGSAQHSMTMKSIIFVFCLQKLFL